MLPFTKQALVEKKTLDGGPYISTWSSMLLNEKNILTSSAYNKVFEFLITDGRSFIKRVNRSGPR